MIVGVSVYNYTQEPSSLSDVPLTMITTVEQLQELSRLLTTVSEFAVDLEVSSVTISLIPNDVTKYNDHNMQWLGVF